MYKTHWPLHIETTFKAFNIGQNIPIEYCVNTNHQPNMTSYHSDHFDPKHASSFFKQKTEDPVLIEEIWNTIMIIFHLDFQDETYQFSKDDILIDCSSNIFIFDLYLWILSMPNIFVGGKKKKVRISVALCSCKVDQVFVLLGWSTVFRGGQFMTLSSWMSFYSTSSVINS